MVTNVAIVDLSHFLSVGKLGLLLQFAFFAICFSISFQHLTGSEQR